MLCGDLLQIPPTRQKSVFSEPSTMQNQALYTSRQNLWKSCESVALLVNKRQGQCAWRDTLDRIRVGEISEDDKKLLETRRVSNDEHKHKNFDDAIHLFFSNEQVVNHNAVRINNLVGGKARFFKADISGYPKGCSPVFKNGFVEETRFENKLTLKRGARVILNLNVDIVDNLVNGVTGTVVDFSFDKSSKKKLEGYNINAIIVKFDDDRVGQDLRKLYQNHPNLCKKGGVPIFRQSFKYKPPRLHTDCHVEQFPLNLFYASTSHKIQGRTLSQDVVCYTEQYMKSGCGYVMLSRCTSIENVYISKDFDFAKVTVHKKSLIETDRLIKICIAAKLKKEKFDIFFMNMRGKTNMINVRYDPLADQSNLVCLVETNMEANALEQWLGRKFFPHASCGRGSGVCAFGKLSEDNTTPYQFIARKTCLRYQILQFSKSDKIQIFVLYVSQDANLNGVATSIQEMLLDDQEVILMGDFNFQSLTKNDLTCYLIETLQLKQLVTGPTFLKGHKTIDHIYVSSELENKIRISSMFRYYGDHLSFTICIE